MPDHFEVRFSLQDQTFHERLKDSRGVERYDFSLLPRIPLGETAITMWQAKLVDLQHRLYDNVLMTAQEFSDDISNDPKTALWRLDPSKSATVPVFAKRIIKVDGFYVVLQVKAFRFDPPDSPYLDSMTVAIEFTNTDPRSAESTPK